MSHTKRASLRWALSAVVVGSALVLVGGALTISCGNTPATTATDGGVDASPDLIVAVTPDCVTNPTTYLEIINACTDAEKITKNPVLPLEVSDALPSLPDATAGPADLTPVPVDAAASPVDAPTSPAG